LACSRPARFGVQPGCLQPTLPRCRQAARTACATEHSTGRLSPPAGRSLTPTPRGDGPGMMLGAHDLFDLAGDVAEAAALGGEDPADRADPVYR
jgi:hypothetical protein